MCQIIHELCVLRRERTLNYFVQIELLRGFNLNSINVLSDILIDLRDMTSNNSHSVSFEEAPASDCEPSTFENCHDLESQTQRLRWR